MQSDRSKFKKEFKQRLYNYVLNFIKQIDKIPKDRVSMILGDQALRSSTSILANYAEGQSASSKRDFIKYFEISLKSANETKIWICLLRDTNKISGDLSLAFMNELNEIANIFASSILTLKGRR